MQKNLIIVESPKKAQLIQGFINKQNLKGYKVMASAGHVRDLKEKSFSIDIENNYSPIYEVSKNKKELIKELKKESDSADLVWLASDEDREGEAISWHLSEVLEIEKEKIRRIAFHEITSEAFMSALNSPRDINKNLVDAQQARRVLDRIVGFELSPVLWKRISKGLSAGRVQSVATRLIVDREREIENFVQESSFRVRAIFKLSDNTQIDAELNHRFSNEQDAVDFVESIKNGVFVVSDVKTESGTRNPSAPFTTSTLQQEASRKLGYSVSQTMRLAQSLYESGHITYMRTDSVNLSNLAMNTIKNTIIETWGESFHKARKYKTASKGAQEAHEAIRPTFVENSDISGTVQERKLYDLIRKRAIASQMASAEVEKTTVTIPAGDSKWVFQAIGEVIKFKGFLEVYSEGHDDDNDSDKSYVIIPQINKGEKLSLDELEAQQRFTQRPPRYTEASMVRTLEKLEIGRPSTYATTIQTIQSRLYVEKKSIEGEKRNSIVLKVKPNSDLKRSVVKEIYGADSNKLFPTQTGILVNDFLMSQFPDIVDYGFTAKVENEFDCIASGELEWTALIDTFYKSFHPTVETASKRDSDLKIGDRILGTDPQTGKEVKVTIGRYGPMVQIGKYEDEEKPKFASLKKNQNIQTISLEEALELFALPKNIGQFEGKDVVIGVGRFGPYIKYNNTFISIPKDIDPNNIDMDKSIELINDKKDKESKSLIKDFGNGLEVRVGHFGPYIKYNGSNYKISKKVFDTDKIESIELEDCLKIVNSEEGKSKKTSKSSSKGKTKSKK